MTAPTPSPIPAPDLDPRGYLLPPNWGEFIPDLISGLLFGGIIAYFVGRALYRWQRDREAELRRRAAQRQWSFARARLASVMRYEYHRTDDAGSIVDNAAPFTKVAEAAKTMDIAAWSMDAPTSTELGIATQLVENVTTISRLAQELQDQLQNRARDHFQGANLFEFQALAYRVLGVALPQHLSETMSRIAPVLDLPEVESMTKPYLRWLAQCEADYNALRNLLRSHDDAPRTS